MIGSVHRPVERVGTFGKQLCIGVGRDFYSFFIIVFSAIEKGVLKINPDSFHILVFIQPLIIRASYTLYFLIIKFIFYF